MSVFIPNILFVSTLINPIFFLFLKIFLYSIVCLCAVICQSVCKCFWNTTAGTKENSVIAIVCSTGVSCELSNLNDGNQLQSLKREVYVLNCRAISPVPLISFFILYEHAQAPAYVWVPHAHRWQRNPRERVSDILQLEL